jgi:hypothetical protein
MGTNWTNKALRYPTVTKLVNDKDYRAAIVMSDLKWDLIEYIGPNHAKK